MKPLSFPRPLAAILPLLPQYPHSLALCTLLNLALKQVFGGEKLARLHGRKFCIRVLDAGVSCHFSIAAGGFIPLRSQAQPDLCISASARDFVLLALRKEDPDALFFNRRLMLEGDTELGLLVKNTLDSLALPPFDPRAFAPGRVLETLILRRLL